MGDTLTIPAPDVSDADNSLRPNQPPLPAAPGQLKFATDATFYSELRRRVDEYFVRNGLRKRDCPRMYFKTATIMVWFAASYGLLVFGATQWWQAAPLAVSLALAMAAIGFNVQHDGGHEAYSRRRWVNKLMATSLDMLGGSSYVWEHKHNTHHSYANITGHDDDINIGIFGRVSPYQRWFSFHRLQHIYLWALYGLLPIKWQLYDDFRDVLTGRIAGQRCPRPKGLDMAIFLLGKCFFFSMALAVPLLRHSFWSVLACYLIVDFIEGLALSIVFQIPHCGEEAAFPMPSHETGRMEVPWAVHQVQTTVDYAKANRLCTWFAGGLNYQIEHHLFPRICHLHYPAIAPLVEETCREFGVRYVAHETFRQGLASHYRLLKQMGQPNPS